MGRRLIMIIVAVFCVFAISAGSLVCGGSMLVSAKESKQYDAEKLIKLKTPYVGNNSKVVTIIDSLPLSILRLKIELNTKKRPYGISVPYEFRRVGYSKEDGIVLRNNAAILFSLIDNIDEINYTLNLDRYPKRCKYLRVQLQQCYEKDLRSYSKDVTTFTRFLKSMDMTFTVKPTQYALIMSSTPGMQITTQYYGKADKVHYTTSFGRFFGWDKKTGKMNEYSSSVVLPLDTPIFWTPLGTPPERGVKNIQIKATVYLKTTAITEKQINIKYDGTLYYSVDSEVL
ncbi:MAG: DUF4825 domain-containing protein [Acidobacteriota bacterium]